MERQRNSREWTDCLRYISGRMHQNTFETWFRNTSGQPTEIGEFEILVANDFCADWIDKHYRDIIEESFNEVLGQEYDIQYRILKQEEAASQISLEVPFTVDPPTLIDDTESLAAAVTEEQINSGHAANGSSQGYATVNGSGTVVVTPVDEDPRRKSEATSNEQPFKTNLNAKYRFDNLVVGDFNRFACAAARAVAEAPGVGRYNPLMIYGGTGLGKTHIVQAIGHEIAETMDGRRVLYATSEQFTSDFIRAVQTHRVNDFSQVYREVDLLIIDDIQFLAGKEGTQEQFFHTFNQLYHDQKQIILTSDRAPRELKKLEDRLVSRFQWGLVTDLQAPDLENRSAIIYKKLEKERISVPDDVVIHIANVIKDSIRDIEGAINRLTAYARLYDQEITIETARNLLKDSAGTSATTVTIAMIQKVTAQHFGIDPKLMKAKKKNQPVARARQVAMYLARILTKLPLKTIGEEFGGRDHTTVMYAHDLIQSKLAEDQSLREKIDNITAELLY